MSLNQNKSDSLPDDFQNNEDTTSSASGQTESGWGSLLFFYRMSHCFLLLSVCVVWFFFLVYFVFAHPVFDDFSRAHEAETKGLWFCFHREYFGWSGRWLGTGLSYLFGYLFDTTRIYGALLFSVALYCIFSLYYFLKTVLPEWTTRDIATLTTVGVALYWSGMPAPGETFYWLTGAFENHVSVATILLTLTLSFRVSLKSSPRTLSLQYIGLAFLSFIIPGFHELFGCVWVCTLFFAVVVSFVVPAYASMRKFWILMTAVALVGLFVVILAPGNGVRIEKQNHHGELVASLMLSAKQLLLCLRAWVANPQVIAASFLLIVSSKQLRVAPAWLSRSRWVWKFLLPLLGIVLMVGCLTGGAYARGKFLSDRPLNAVFGTFLLVWFGTLYAWFAASGKPKVAYETEASYLKMATLATLLLGWSFLNSGRMTEGVIQDLRLHARNYDRAARARYASAKQAVKENQLDLVVPPYEKKCALYKQVDISSDPNSELNQYFARYFGLNSVRVEKSEIKKK